MKGRVSSFRLTRQKIWMDLMTGALALSYDDARTTGRTTAPGDEAPRVILKMETIGPLYSSTAWRLPRAYTPLTPEERAEYYKAYDPMTGVKIAATLSGLLTMAVLYVFYKVSDSYLSGSSGSELERKQDYAIYNSLKSSNSLNLVCRVEESCSL